MPRSEFFTPTTTLHAPVLLGGPALLDYIPASGLYRVYDAAPGLTFPCECAASGPLDVAEGNPEGHQIVAMDLLTLDYVTQTGRFDNPSSHAVRPQPDALDHRLKWSGDQPHFHDQDAIRLPSTPTIERLPSGG